jgi:hypothetical protein
MTFAQQRTAQIYKIYFDEHEECYVGSTVQTISKRFYTHKNYCKKGKDKRLYNFIREHGDWSIVRYEVLHTVLVISKREQLEHEQKFIDELQPSLNLQRAYTSAERAKQRQIRYNELHKEHLAQKNKEYNKANKEHIAQKKKEYADANKDKIKEYQRQYSQTNKAHLQNYKREYRQANKEMLSTKHKQRYQDPDFKAKKKAIALAHYQRKKLTKVECDCGLTTTTKGTPLTLANIKRFQRKNCKCTSHKTL